MKKKKLSGKDEYAKEIGKAVIPKVIGWGVGIGAGYFLVLRPILISTGIIKSAEDKKRDQIESQYGTALNSAFNPQWYKTIPGAILITRAKAEELAEIIQDAMGWFNDDEDAIYAVFRQLKAKTQVSWLADVFFQQYNADLYQYLRGRMSDSEMDIVHSIVNNLQ